MCESCQKSMDGAKGEALKCGECKAARYCSKECQTKAWKGGHKQQCKILCARQAESASDGLMDLWSRMGTGLARGAGTGLTRGAASSAVSSPGSNAGDAAASSSSRGEEVD